MERQSVVYRGGQGQALTRQLGILGLDSLRGRILFPYGL